MDGEKEMGVVGGTDCLVIFGWVLRFGPVVAFLFGEV